MKKANKIIENGGRGRAKLQNKKGRLEIRFSKQTFGKDKVMALKMADSPDNYPHAKSILALINADISAGKFDFTLEKYRPTLLVPPEVIAKSPLIIFVWENFLKANRCHWKDSTWNYLKVTIEKWIPTQFCIDDAEVYRDWLLARTTVSMSKRVLTWVRAAIAWWSDLHSRSNPFRNITRGLKHKWEETPSPRPFSEDEVRCILENFEKSQYYSFYSGFVKFLLKTGCRPSEAVGLQWSKVFDNSITFSGGISYSGGKAFTSNTSKNKRTRRFPLSQAIQEILIEQKGRSELWVFPNYRGTSFINYNNFRRRAWKKCASVVVPEATPYNCRDTFISNQLAANIPPAYIAKWCDTSIAMIEKFYFAINDSYLPV